VGFLLGGNRGRRYWRVWVPGFFLRVSVGLGGEFERT
jgi:hypothetical protein